MGTVIIVAVVVVLLAYGLSYWAFRARTDRSAAVGLYLLIGFPALFVAAIGLAISTVGGNPASGLLFLVPGAAFALPLAKPFRRVVAAVTPMDPNSPVDMVGLSVLLGALALFGVLSAATRGLVPTDGIEAIPYVDVVAQNIALLAVAYCAVGVVHTRSWGAATERLGITPPTPRVVGAGLGFAVLSLLVLIVTGAIGQALQPGVGEQVSEVVDAFTADLQNPIGALVIGVSAGVGEEALFRGAVQPRFGIVFVSILFASIHLAQYGFNVAVFGIFGVSILLGIERQRFGTTAAMITHALYNAVQVLFLALAQ